jgi:hypothetical protein
MKLGGWEDQFTRRNFFNFWACFQSGRIPPNGEGNIGIASRDHIIHTRVKPDNITSASIHIAVFWAVTPCSFITKFRGTWYFHLQGLSKRFKDAVKLFCREVVGDHTDLRNGDI